MTKGFFIATLIVASLSESRSQTFHRPPSEHCQKYCFTDCYELLETLQSTPSLEIFDYSTKGDKFSDCLAANRYCFCATRMSLKNPVYVLSLGLLGLGIILALIRFYLQLRKRTTPSVSVSTIYIGTRSRRVDSTTSNVSYIDIENPTFVHSSDDSPPDYLPPPSYQEYSDQMKANNSSDNQIKKEEKVCT